MPAVHLPYPPRRVRFGPFEADLKSGELRKHGVKVHLQPQPFQILALLLQHGGEVVTREQLRDELWADDTFVGFNHGLDAAIRKLRSALGDSATKPRYIETRSKRGYRLIIPVEEFEPRRIESIVVLPFVNLSTSPEADYFAEGMTDELITNLAKIGSLRVISRTSAMCYRNTKKAISEISRELRVDAAIEGTVRRAGNKVRINAQLIDGVTDAHVWTETYESEIDDILFLQSTITAAIATTIGGELTERERARLAKARPVVKEAYDAYLRARHAWGKGTAEDLKRSALLFEEAIERDPTYPLAYVGLADSYLVRAFYSVLAPHSAYPKARAAATRALEIDKSTGEALASLANVYLNFDWDWPAAEAAYTRSLALCPNYPTTFQWHSQLSMILGRFDEALARILRAQELDPLSIRISSMIGWVYYFTRQYDRARDHLQAVLEHAPDSAMAHLWLGQVLQQMGAWQPAISELEQAVARFGSNVHLGSLASAYAEAGVIERAIACISRMRQLEQGPRHFPAYALAEAYAGLDDHESAFVYLRKAYTQREPALLFIGVEPRMDRLRNDPRFGNLINDLRLRPAPSNRAEAAILTARANRRHD